MAWSFVGPNRSRDELLGLLAFVTGYAVDAIRQKGERADTDRLLHGEQLARAVKLDMTVWYKDGELFLMDASVMTTQQGSTRFRGVGTQRNSTLSKALRLVFMRQQKKGKFPDFIFPIRPDHRDNRISSQSSCFTFHVSKRSIITKAENDTLESLVIPAAAKSRMERELFLLGVDHFSVYGGLEGLAHRLRVAYGVK